uniref:hypothetical protein n=1 Tax=Brachyspira catarrhinii TaxID=2528966 RepID=UPI003F4C463D
MTKLKTTKNTEVLFIDDITALKIPNKELKEFFKLNKPRDGKYLDDYLNIANSVYLKYEGYTYIANSSALAHDSNIYSLLNTINHQILKSIKNEHIPYGDYIYDYLWARTIKNLNRLYTSNNYVKIK